MEEAAFLLRMENLEVENLAAARSVVIIDDNCLLVVVVVVIEHFLSPRTLGLGWKLLPILHCFN